MIAAPPALHMSTAFDLTGSSAAVFARPVAQELARPHRSPGTGTFLYYPTAQSRLPGTGAVFVVEQSHGTPLAAKQDRPASPYAGLMARIKNDLAHGAMSRLPKVFGVSRQTLYNWLSGDLPGPEHHERLIGLAEAAREIGLCEFKIDPAQLDEPFMHGKSLLEHIRDGAPGTETALRFLRAQRRALAAQSDLDAVLGNRQVKLSASDFE